MKLLLFSNSTNAGEPYLGYTLPFIKSFIDNKPVKALFIPYAGVSINWDDYYTMVKEQLVKTGIELEAIHHFNDPVSAVDSADMIIVGGGNTFNLLKTIQDNDLVPVIQKKVLSGTPYIGWSAGSNLACPTIRTTNDMPVVEPDSFEALGLIPFQINPHYLDANPDGHAGETREMRIEEFMIANPDMYVAGLRESTMLLLENNELKLQGERTCRVFKHNIPITELTANDDLSFLLDV